MRELKVYIQCYDNTDGLFYLKSEVDKVIAELEESHKMEVEQLLMKIVELKSKMKVQTPGEMTHAEFAQEVLKEWNLKPGQMSQSCYCQWYHYTIPSGEPFPENKIIGEYTLRKGKAVFVLTKQDGTEQVWEAK